MMQAFGRFLADLQIVMLVFSSTYRFPQVLFGRIIVAYRIDFKNNKRIFI